MNKLKTNFNLDVTMAIFYLLIMEPKLTGLALHEWIGLCLGIVFIVHIFLHWDWIVEATKRYFGKFPKKSKLNYWLDIFLVIGSFFILLSGLPISRKIGFSWLGIGGDIKMWQHLHVAVAFIILLIIAIHIGLHWKWVINALKKVGKYEIRIFPLPVKSLFIITIITLGVYSFNYTDYFNTIVYNLDYKDFPVQSKNTEENYKNISSLTSDLYNPAITVKSKSYGRGGGSGGRGSGSGYPSYTVTDDSSSIVAYFGISVFVILVVYYLEILVNKIFKKKKKILLN